MKKITYLAAMLLMAAGTLVSCSNDESASPNGSNGSTMSTDGMGGGTGPNNGKGGSMARFAVNGNHLYTVDNSTLRVFDISNPREPKSGNSIDLMAGVETIFPYNNNLFIGTRFGLYIYSLQNPVMPTHLSYYQHITSCDPVVADSRYAYVTLSAGNTCMRGVNRLEVVDLSTITNPSLLAEYPMTNPKGLGVDGTNLFVCDDGLKVYDATQVTSMQMRQHFKINAYDVIPDNGNLLVIGSDGLYQYSYQNSNLSLLSKLPMQPPM